VELTFLQKFLGIFDQLVFISHEGRLDPELSSENRTSLENN